MSYTLVLLRHGESEWNAKNLFTGWVDVPLSEKGRVEAETGGRLLAESGLLPDVVHTSVLRRAISTANIALDVADRHWIDVRRSWRLNERHYGALQGKNKKQTLEQFGEEQFMLWRRSYDVPPPPIEDRDEYSQSGDPRYAELGAGMPRTECLKDVVARMLPYWEAEIVPDLRAGRTVLVAAHGNSLRALVKHLDEIGDEEIAGLNIPTGIPLLYELDESLTPTVRGGRYLVPDAAGGPLSFGLVGHGWRADFFLRVAAALPGRLRCTGVVTRGEAAGAEVERRWGVPTHRSIDAMLSAGAPLAVVTSVPWAATPGVVRELVARGTAVLAETPPAPDAEGLRSLWADVGASGLVQVAEQNPFLPVLVALGRLVDAGVLGTPTSATRSWTHGYYAVAVLRRLLRAGGEPVTVRASAAQGPLVQGPGRSGRPVDPAEVAAVHTVASL